MFLGIDVGAKKLHCVALGERLQVLDAWIHPTSALDDLPKRLDGASMAAIDAPEELSSAPHRDDDSLSNKFRTARCAEIALGREHKIWVPWVTPVEGEAIPAWIAIGFRVFELTNNAGARAIEVYPHAGYRVLAKGPIQSKTTAQGLAARVQLLRGRGIDVEGLEMWSHDSLDACLAAVIARDVGMGNGAAVTCAHDGSRIWLPSTPR